MIVLIWSGELIGKKTSEPIDGIPFTLGLFTLLKQFHTENTDMFLAYLGQYVRSHVQAAVGFVNVFHYSCLLV